MDNVVPIEQLDSFIQEVIAKVNNGLAASRKAGILVEMPDAIQITAVVTKEWQPASLEIVGSRESNETGKQGGKTIESQSNAGTETTNSNDQSLQVTRGTNAHKQTTQVESVFIS